MVFPFLVVGPNRIKKVSSFVEAVKQYPITFWIYLILHISPLKISLMNFSKTSDEAFGSYSTFAIRLSMSLGVCSLNSNVDNFKVPFSKFNKSVLLSSTLLHIGNSLSASLTIASRLFFAPSLFIAFLISSISFARCFSFFISSKITSSKVYKTKASVKYFAYLLTFAEPVSSTHTLPL